MLIVDFSQVAISSIHAFSNDLKKGTTEECEGIIRHIILNSILASRKRFPKAKYGQVVIAIDDRSYWRRDIFPQYKGNRKAARDASDLDWDAIYVILNKIREEIKENFPYKVVHVEKAEADDIIAVLCKYTQDHETTQVGFEKELQNVVIVSEDQDFVQLQCFPNVQQYLPRKRKLHEKLSKKDLQDFITEHIVKAGDDGIPNLLSPDDVFVTEPKQRQGTVTAKRLAEFKELGRDACKNDIEKSRWDRNRRLIDFGYIPEDLQQAIVSEYQTVVIGGDRGKIFNYLVKNKCRVLLDSVEEF